MQLSKLVVLATSAIYVQAANDTSSSADSGAAQMGKAGIFGAGVMAAAVVLL